MTQTTENKAVERATFTDEWMAEKVRAEGMDLTKLAEAFALDGVNVLDDEGDGIFNLALIEEKDFLRGMPFMIVRWRFNESDKYKDDEGNNGVFVSAEIAYQAGPNAPLQTGVINDGSGTGICGQLQQITKKRKENLEKLGKGNDPYAGRFVRRGLRRSDYMRDTGKLDKNNVPIMEAATTFYLDI